MEGGREGGRDVFEGFKGFVVSYGILGFGVWGFLG